MRTTTMERLTETELRAQVETAVRETLAAVMTVPTPGEARDLATRLHRLRPYVAEHLRSLPAQKLAIHLREAEAYLTLWCLARGGDGERFMATVRHWLEKAREALAEWRPGGKG